LPEYGVSLFVVKFHGEKKEELLGVSCNRSVVLLYLVATHVWSTRHFFYFRFAFFNLLINHFHLRRHGGSKPAISVADPWIRVRDPGWVEIQDSDPSRIREEHPGSFFREFKNNFWDKIPKFFYADPDSGSGNLFDPGSWVQDPGWKN
jgi:hypothetical protein